MNLGFYVESNGGTPQNKQIYEFLNNSIESGLLTDAALFFNSVNFNAVPTKFAMFDAANLWSFTGHLVATSITNVTKARSIANKLNLAYLYTSSDRNENNLYEIVNASKAMPVFVMNLLDYRDCRRITGLDPVFFESFTLDNIGGLFNEKR